MAIMTVQEKLQNKKAQIDALQTKIIDNSIIEATIVGKVTVDGNGKISNASTVKTQYDTVETKIATLTNEVLLEEASLPMLQTGYTQLKDTDLSCVWGCRSMQSSTGSRSYTTELGTPNTYTFIYALLSSVLKVYKNSVGASLPAAQRAFKIDPEFLPNIKSNFINNPAGCDDVFLYSNSDYAGQDFFIFAIKNPTGTNKTFAFDYNGSAYTTYSRTGVFQITPSISSASIYAGNPYTFNSSSLADITSSASTTDRTVNITIPAGFTSLIIFYSSVKYVTTNTAGRDSYIRNLATNLNAQSLVQDSAVMENIRRVMTGQRINPTINYTDIALVEDIFKYRPASLTPIYANNTAALSALELAGNQYYNITTGTMKIVLLEFANNAAALAGGLVVGQIYYNTTTSTETLVI